MYHSKHQNGYRISHKTPKRKFRTWKSKKKWLYGLTLISLTVSSLLPLGNLAFIPRLKMHMQQQALLELWFRGIQVMTQAVTPTLELSSLKPQII